MGQALKAARAATRDERIQRQVLNAVAGLIPELSMDTKPPAMARQVYRLVREITGNNDPFHQAKIEANRAALKAYPRMKELLHRSPDRLLTACRLAIAGNSLDLGPSFDPGDLHGIINGALASPLAIDHYTRLSNKLSDSQRLLYLGDNTGEVVFDRLLIEEIHRIRKLDVCFVVRATPVINDVTMDEALAVGMHRVSKVVSNGSDAPGTILSECSNEMQGLYRSSDIVIAKGQGNYESLEGEPGHVFFLLRAKCPVLAGLLGVQVGDAVLKEQTGFK